MKQGLSRRNLVKGVLTASVVLGFNTITRTWATNATYAEEHAEGALATDFPDFDGQLLTDPDSLNQAAEDFGHIEHKVPQAVLLPASKQDIIKLMRFANQHMIVVSVKGQGFSTAGETLADAGVVIDTSSLNTIQSITNTTLHVDAGARWLDVMPTLLEHQKTLPIVVDFLEITVGGSISVGGFGAQSFKHGAMTDIVESIEIVTGQGQLLQCSAKSNGWLFNAIRAGLGQFGIIVSACFKLEPAFSMARYFQLIYTDFASFSKDNLFLIESNRFDGVQGGVQPSETGGWLFILQATKYYNSDETPDNAALLKDLNYNPDALTVQDMPFLTFLNRLAPIIEYLRSTGLWDYPHPWCPLLIPASKAESFVNQTLQSLKPEDLGGGPILLSGFNHCNMPTPLLRKPDEKHFFYFSLMRNATPPTKERAKELMLLNRDIYESAQQLGGYYYPVGAIPMEQKDWSQHFGRYWRPMKMLKQWMDPKHILNPGRAIFNK
ncbi:FAD-binding protein [Zooshikella harenae]|uniref:FAD-binding protein n=1 Tax=Zooshikella harenae TaxID=2827238 RepID=A0ABS5ZBW5_9GAMM|nr:FAD-binding protein [Zooshikella harenae]MBU2711373.1 FAD-binding protein [Zooshikella harenae]